MTTGSDWQDRVGRSWAAMYRQTDRSFAPVTQLLLERVAALPGEAVLDIGCGAGEIALAIAHQRPAASVVGLDISADLLAIARDRGQKPGNAEFVEGDAARWSRPGFAADLLVSRHGVMFFDDPVAAFSHLSGLARDNAVLVFSCFRTPGENPWMSELAAILAAFPLGLPDSPAPDPYAPGPFAFADPERVRAILGAAGWCDIGIDPVDFAYIAGEGDDPVVDALRFFSRIGPAAATLAALDESRKVSALAAMRAWLDGHRSGSLVSFPAAAWFVSARNG